MISSVGADERQTYFPNYFSDFDVLLSTMWGTHRANETGKMKMLWLLSTFLNKSNCRLAICKRLAGINLLDILCEIVANGTGENNMFYAGRNGVITMTRKRESHKCKFYALRFEFIHDISS